MVIQKSIVSLLFCLVLYVSAGVNLLFSQPVQTDNAEVELISENLTIKPGEPFWIGVRMDLRDGWYVYYRNPGDSGMPLMAEWMHENDFQIGDIQWPYPLWIDVGAGLASYGYYGDVLFMMEATAPPDLEPGTEYMLKAEADYLICEKVCIPEYVEIELTLGVTGDEVEYNEEWLSWFADTRSKLPVELDYWTADAYVSDDGKEITLELTTDAFELPEYSEVIYFANEEGEIENASKPEFRQDGQKVILTMQKSGYKSEDVTRVWGLVYNADGWDDSGEIKAITVDADLAGGEELLSADTSESPLAVFSSRFLIILGFAFTGGLILNLMPCVFPILSIKVMNFMQMSGHNPGEVKKHGFVFGAGVILSFLVLAGLLLLLRAGGQELGWGFQLQTPAFIAFMTFLMFGLGLSLMGVFEIGNSLINVAGKAGTGEGLRGSFFSGILATILATPCTAPFMGTALGVAITLPASTALMIFATLGIGMAAPYVLLSSFPALMKYLPKPGAWMETFKQAMAFPLFATAIWLIWVFGQQAGVDGLTKLLVGLLFLSLGIWIIHRWNRYKISGRTRVISRSIATLFIVGGFLFSASSEAITFDGESASVDGYGIEWEPFSNRLVEEYRDDGRNVFIDFTAAWCITCKANERIIFSSNRVKERFEELDFVMVKADWTNRNPEITRALESFGRNGVPLYVVYSEEIDEPMILPELLTPGIVLDALDRVSAGETLTYGDDLHELEFDTIYD
ncbi:thiol:disulfide interchange protein [Rhodohalobacter sp. SW132]|uniref:protein-disulfide reductase DsbD family protein n=1 Tax=Rhodohalobacter sp. SW132 TaxID=2293433 RepID=UPI000E228269|nr:thioredoxin family protein [Rhodohalobacter sp. SW132]REL32962.1 thiol:disulfide interchange protein [Rhodohalobacter sp. SW132]